MLPTHSVFTVIFCRSPRILKQLQPSVTHILNSRVIFLPCIPSAITKFSIIANFTTDASASFTNIRESRNSMALTLLCKTP